MRYSKLKISSDATSRLRTLRNRTGLTPNLLCRIALAISLQEGPIGKSLAPDQEGSEFNAYTLTGEYDALFTALLRWVEQSSQPAMDIDDDDLIARLQGHIHRGVGTLSVRVKSAADILRLIPPLAKADHQGA